MCKSFFPKTLAALLFFLSGIAAYAEFLDENQARYAAAEFFSPSSHSTRLRARGLQLKLRSNGHENGYYIFDRPEGGCVFVADDDAIGHTVLGYTDDGCFDAGNLPIGLQDWLEQVSVLMDAVHEGKISRNKVQRRAGEIIVKKLINTSWGQGSPYNNLCPLLDGKRCITGCVATAMAQVMKYWEWPEHGYGSVSYTDTKGCGLTLKQDFSSSYYDWANMRDSYTSALSYNSKEANAVALLMRDCGYAVHMTYTPESSGANVSPVDLAKYFHYSAAAKERYSYQYPEDVWHEFIRQDLMARRPVLYSGRSSEEGHQFILDGLDSEGYYHVNWGWGGGSDGWFILTNLKGYNNNQDMINELVPDKGNGGFSYTLTGSVLTINGMGVIPQDYVMDNAPWADKCKNVRKIVFGEGITDIPNYFGNGNESDNSFTNLKTLVLPEGLRSIGEAAFEYSGLTSVQLPSTLVSMDNAFWGCSIKELHLPKNLITYTDYLPALERLTVDEENPRLSVVDNILYSKDCKHLLFVPGGLPRIVIAEATEEIFETNILRLNMPVVSKCTVAPALSDYVLAYPNYLVQNSGYLFVPIGSTGYNAWKKILPSGWTVLNYSDYDYLPEMKVTWTLKNGVLTISGWGAQKSDEYGYDDAPYYASRFSIKKLVVEEGVNSLCWAAYWGYSMTEAELPSTLTSINGSCFGYTDLTSITCYARQAPILDDEAFVGLPNYGTLRVPTGSNYSSWLQVLPSGWSVEYFTPEPLATCHLYTGEQKEVQDLTEWEKLQTQYPNAIGIISPRKKDWAYLASNLLIEDASAEGGYCCPYLLLTDLSNGFGNASKAPLTGFAAPVSFTVSKGSYLRALKQGYSSVCLPFAVSEEALPQDCHMYAYSHFDEDKSDVVFVPQTTTAPGHACFVSSSADVTWKVDLSGKNIIAGQASAEDINMRGTFVSTDACQGVGYSPRNKDNVFAPLSQYLHPFRACILINASAAPSQVRIRVTDVDDDADGLHITEGAAGTRGDMYLLDGRRISSPVKGQPYIENGKIIIR